MAYLNRNRLLINLKYTDTGAAEEAKEKVFESIQAGGTRTNYAYAFTRTAYNKDTFKPKYNFKPDSVADMFSYIACDDKVTANMVELEQEQGIEFDFSGCTAFTRTFAGDLFSVLSTIDLSKATSLQYTFYQGYGADRNLTRIERLICSTTTTFHSSTFNLATHLEYIGFEGMIAKSITLSSCPLTPESMKKAILCLANFAGADDEYSTTIKFSDECWAALEADSTAPDGGTWANYVYNLGWNI